MVIARSHDVRLPLDKRLLTTGELRALCASIQAGLTAAEQLAADDSITSVRRRRLERAVTDGVEATNEVIVRNLRLVLSVCSRMPSPFPGYTFEDMFMAGVFGLHRAAQKFDPSRGFQFSTYATHWIRQAVQRGGKDYKPGKLPVRELEQFLSSRGSMSESHRHEVEAMMATWSIDAPLKPDSDATIADVVEIEGVNPIDELCEESAAREIIRSVLDEREAAVWMLRHPLSGSCDKMSVSEVAITLGLTEHQVRGSLNRAQRKLRTSSAVRDLASAAA